MYWTAPGYAENPNHSHITQRSELFTVRAEEYLLTAGTFERESNDETDATDWNPGLIGGWGWGTSCGGKRPLCDFRSFCCYSNHVHFAVWYINFDWNLLLWTTTRRDRTGMLFGITMSNKWARRHCQAQGGGASTCTVAVACAEIDVYLCACMDAGVGDW